MLKKILIIGILLSAITLNATDIKGRINGINAISEKPYPLKGINVEIYVKNNQDWIKKDKFLTNSDGMYYFKNLEAGEYTIQVNGKSNYPILVLDQEKQELPPIIINYK